MAIDTASRQISTGQRMAGGTTVHSIDDAMGVMSGWRLELFQMSPGKIRYSLSVVQFGSIQVFRERTDKALLKRGLSWPGSLVFSLPIDAQGTGWLSGHEVDPEISLLVDGRMLPEILTPQHFDLIYVAIDRQHLAAFAAERGQAGLVDHILHSPSLALWHDRDAGLAQIFSGLFDEDTRLGSGQADHAALELFVLEKLLAALTLARKIEAVADTDNKRLTDRARLMLMKNRSEPPTISEVANHLGISRRYLQTCFNRSVGLPAKEFVRAERLNSVRSALCQARRENRVVSIGDVAALWGFWHLSRFAGDYRDMFGELPSETLHPPASSQNG
ncbi:helix-turn-helix domain-containing protein [Rhizobium sp. C4]|uniref:helix-turn-helix domain-containing protein n=1 Tax=Rhizobium sp. C4 TaxID=1349800 RepID=UPI001E3013FC|nr:helix-turn-helix domain-containing protein [Rhizobium sp. C4]MCD2172084.1 helix-turn-helix domain-containing protein [Rhizobium sp. C4]